MKKTKTLNLILVIFISTLVLSSCAKKSEDIKISSEKIIIDTNGVEIICNPALMREKRTASVLLRIEGDWNANPPWKEIEFTDGRKAEIKITAYSDKKDKFDSSVIGSVSGDFGKMVNIRFVPEIPQNVKIERLLITSSSRIVCREITWHDFNNL